MLLSIELHDWGRSLLDLFIPRTCVVCGKALPLREEHICARCLCDLPRTHYSTLSRNPMANRFNDLIQRDFPADWAPYSYATSLFFYRAGYKEITKSLKYRRGIATGEYFSRLLAREMVGSHLYSDVDLVLPVPLHWTRLRSRGYNQAEVIGKVVSRYLDAEFRTDVLKRVRRTRTQTRLSVEGKVRNVSRAFRVLRNTSLSGYGHILIVDDVFTTGATLHACYLAVKESGLTRARISVATLACIGG